jgi:copper resistance protein C
MRSLMCVPAWIRSLVMATVFMVPASSVFAHSALTASLPGHETVVASPDTLMLRFNEQVRLLRVTLVHGAGHHIDFGFAATTTAQQEFSYELPTLMLGEHTVNWTVIGADGHTISNSFKFTVSNDGVEAEVQAHQGDHHHH